MGSIAENHTILFHYTNVAGLRGIIDSQTLHATHFKYSNDTTEMEAIRPKLEELAASVLKNRLNNTPKNDKLAELIKKYEGIENLVHKEAKNLINSLYRSTFGVDKPQTFFEPYIVSFCHHADEYERNNGLLSQWRGYGRDSGYAIVFETIKLEKLLRRETCLHAYDSAAIGDVIYGGDEAGFAAEFPVLMNSMKDAFSLVLDRKQINLEDLYASFVNSVSRYKHQGFREEKEVRLYLSRRDPALTEKLKASDPSYSGAHKGKVTKEVLLRDNFVPYIDVFRSIEDRQLPIVKIIVGPHRDKLDRRERLRKYLQIKGLNIEATCSETPLV